jgi:hypothetical protein
MKQRQTELDGANKTIQDLSLQLQMVQTDANKELQNLREHLASAEQERDHHSSHARTTEQKKLQLLEEAAEDYSDQI